MSERLPAGVRIVLYRFAGLAALLLAVSFVVFSLLYLEPGNVVDILLGTAERTPAQVAAIRAEYHLDQPFLMQYLLWLRAAVHLDFGRSVMLNRSVISAIAARLPVTLFLDVYALVLSIAAGLVLGVAAARYKGTSVDRGAVGLAVFGMSSPSFATGLVLLWVFGIFLGWFPVIGAGSGSFDTFGGWFDRLSHLTLPAIALAITGTALMTRMTRAAMISSLAQDYVGFARSRGVSERRILFVYCLRNSLVPIITAAGLVLAATLTGSVLIEATFNLHGIGSLLISSITNKDVPVVQGTTVLIAAMIVFVNLVIDLSYLVIDPRMRAGVSRG